jgi:hypothetical protein
MPFDPSMSGLPPAFMAFFGLVVVLVIGGIVFTVFKGVSQWRANEASPLRSVDALVVSRRTDVRRSSSAMTHGTPGGTADGAGAGTHLDVSSGSSTSYFVTFEEEAGGRRELQVSGSDYGQLAEGDRGHLIHQGTRYKGFTRLG